MIFFTSWVILSAGRNLQRLVDEMESFIVPASNKVRHCKICYQVTVFGSKSDGAFCRLDALGGTAQIQAFIHIFAGNIGILSLYGK